MGVVLWLLSGLTFAGCCGIGFCGGLLRVLWFLLHAAEWGGGWLSGVGWCVRGGMIFLCCAGVAGACGLFFWLGE